MHNPLPEIININTVKDVQAQRYLLDLIQSIDLDASLEYLGVTINETDIDMEEYSNYLYNYIVDEIDSVLATIAENDPKTWIPVVNSIKEQVKEDIQPIRICIHLQYINDFGSVIESVVNELVLIPKPHTQGYILITFNQNYDSIVHYATNEYLNPDLSTVTENVKLKC